MKGLREGRLITDCNDFETMVNKNHTQTNIRDYTTAKNKLQISSVLNIFT